MAHIYLKEAIKVFPAPFHPLIPTLFMESGKMPCSSNDKTKQCVILVNLAGIYFLRPNKLQKGYKISKFLSSFLITEITYEEGKRTIYTKDDNCYIQCAHMDEAVVQLVSARKFLLSKYYERSPVKFNGFPTPPTIETLNVEGVKLLPLQYVCYCAQHFEKPDENGILLLFKKFNPASHFLLGLDAYCRAPSHLNCLCGPLHLLDTVSTLFFMGFAPYCACRVVHKIMRHQSAIHNFILDSYKELVPEQLRMHKLSPKSLISIAIQNCRLPEEQMVKLFKEFGEFGGEIQRLTLRNIELTDKSWKELLNSMTKCRSFRTIEVFELEKIDTLNLSETELREGFIQICKHCRFIQKYSISMWTPSLPFSNIRPFLVTTFLYQLSLQGQNINETFPESFRLPNLLISLDFSHCSFNYSSLKSLFLLLSRTPEHSPITLSLADLVLSSPEWNQFYQEIPKLNQPSYISQLDWSGNPIRSIFVENFVSFFFSSNPIKFLSIDRIFGTNNIDDFKKLINLIPKGKLKGLSIGGSAENNFCGGFPQFFDIITSLGPLNIIHLIGQKIKVNDINSLFQFLNGSAKTMWEIFIDDTDLQNTNDFFNLYKRLFAFQIPIMGRPEIDLERLFGPKNLVDPNTRQELEKFKATLARLPNVPSKICRSYFFSRRDNQKGLEFKDYAIVIQKFPLVFFDSTYIDRYQLQFRLPRTLPSLIPNLAKTKVVIRSLSDLHATTLTSPDFDPKYQDINEEKENLLEKLNTYKAVFDPSERPQIKITPTQQQDNQFQQQTPAQDSQYQQQQPVQDNQFQQQTSTQDSQFQQQQTPVQDNQCQQQVTTQDSQFQQQQTPVQDNQYQQQDTLYQDTQYQQYGNQDGQYQQYQDGQYQMYQNTDGQYQQYGNQDNQYQQYVYQDDQYQQQYGYQDQYQQYGGQDTQYQQYGNQDGQYQQYGYQDGQYQNYQDQNGQYQQFAPQDGQYQQQYGYQDAQYQQQYGNIPLAGQQGNSSIDLMYSPEGNQQFYQQDLTASTQQFFQQDTTANQNGSPLNDQPGNQL